MGCLTTLQHYLLQIKPPPCHIVGDNGTILILREITHHSAMEELQCKADSIYIIGNLSRAGTLTFANKLEYTHYPPTAALNDQYHIFTLSYMNILHYIIEIPARDYNLAAALAESLNLRLVSGMPEAQCHERFRLRCGMDQCFTLENLTLTNLTESQYAEKLRLERQAALEAYQL